MAEIDWERVAEEVGASARAFGRACEAMVAQWEAAAVALRPIMRSHFQVVTMDDGVTRYVRR